MQKEILGDALVAAGTYNVHLSSRGNPDLGQDPTRSIPGVPGRIIEASSLSGASRACQEYIDEYELGGGNWTGGQITRHGNIVAQVSYNGRVWEAKSS